MRLKSSGKLKNRKYGAEEILAGKFPKATLRRKDYMAYLAIVLFMFVIAFEILLVTWIPRTLHSSEMWQDQIACEEMIQLEDLLRAYMIDSKRRSKVMDGEIGLLQDSLDEIAGYLREHKENITRDQIDVIYRHLKYFESIYRSNIKKDKSFNVAEKIDTAKYLDRLLLSANPAAGNGKVRELEK